LDVWSSPSNGQYLLINSATCTITLPSAASLARVGVKVISATVTNIKVVTTSASITIDGVSGTTGIPIYNQYDSLHFISDGSVWYIES